MIDGVVIGRVRTALSPDQRRQHSTLPPTVVRLRVAHLLAQSALTPAALPPAAILLIRQMHDPRPRTLAIDAQPKGQRQWERAVRQELAVRHERAVRPVQGQIPGNPDALLFADEAELLACLALDLAQGIASTRWWWQVILRRLGLSTQPTPFRLLTQQVEQMPALFHLLSSWDKAVKILLACSPTETERLLSQLLQTHQVTAFQTSGPSTPGTAVDEGSRQSETAPNGATHQSGATIEAANGWRPPWQPWLKPAAPAALSPTADALLGVALTLFHRPGFAQSPAFTSAAHRWWWHRTALVLPTAPLNATTTEITKTTDAQPDAIPIAAGSGSQSIQPAGVVPARAQSSQTGEQPTLDPLWGAPPLAPPTATGTPPVAVETPLDSRQGRPDVTPAARPATAATSPVQSALLLGANTLRDGVTTEVGGLLYLINMLERLRLPAWFAADWGIQSHVGPWGVLESVGRGLLAATGVALLADPIWAALAHLAGRTPPALPGEALLQAGPPQLPAAWAAPWPATPLADEPPLVGPLVDPLNPVLRDWLALVLPYLRHWLCRRLSLGDAPADSKDIGHLLALRGRLFVTSSHVDLVLRLAQINLAARRSGLDQDPGWLPHWGRVIKFHFVE
ncbi:MAG: hypothetical protein DYG89_48185 [Caldilinea sp. CFX5]|nr:hypothetical protein [Caldilinea sp. CFX5]